MMDLRYRVLFTLLVLAAPTRAQWQFLGPSNTYEHTELAAGQGVVLVGLNRTGAPFGIYRSTDGGTTWTNPLQKSAPGIARIEGAFLVPRGDQIDLSDATGQTWSTVNTTGGSFSATHVVYERARRRLYAATGQRGFNHLFRSLDQGRSWTAISVAGLAEKTTFVHARGDSILAGYNGTNGGAFVSRNGGQTWTRASLTAIQYPAGAFIDTDGTMYVVGATTGVFGNTNKVYRSRDGGQTWSDLTATTPTPTPPAVPLEMRAVVYAEGARILFAAGRSLYFSSDGGATWTSRGEGLPSTGSGSTVSMAADGGYLYVLQKQFVPGQSTGYGVYRRPLADFGFSGALVGVESADAGRGPSMTISPNPAPIGATITLTLEGAGPARVGVYDALGREVAVLHDGALAAGSHRFRWEEAAPPGIYLVLLVAGDTRETRTLVRLP